ncbi:NnrS family protein [Hahella sp. KA22]|uniref:NnrS family protein n=1 Tax=Hahella sp. KA22 TaxID=1628392 RepID=UPI000FDE0957|nr:NnrS family protein [Hahella sp. KA22]AZZ94026.1 NnrS family protein [Hahella sp. KA22]QAY57400.1 NnrS family protein [Hahella sp. KA22]
MTQIASDRNPRPTLPLLGLAFRPFFLFGSLFSIVAIAYWILLLNGAAPWLTAMSPVVWHGHEMVFGFGGAIVIGFLLTAVQTWTGLPSVNNKALAALVLLWLTARIAFFLGGGALRLAIVAEILWWALSALTFINLLVRSSNHRNLIIAPVLLLMATLDIASATVSDAGLALHLLNTGVLMMCVLITLLGGRVIPFFTQRGLSIDAITTPGWLEKSLALLTPLTALAFFGGRFLPVLASVTAWLLLTTGALQLLRIAHWRSLKTFGVPLLWSLHFSYLALALGQIGMGLSLLSQGAHFADALHLVTVGAIGGMILAMMSRVSLGHTGRPLQPPALMAWAFALILAAAVVRAGLPLVMAAPAAWRISAALWVLAYLVFVIHYAGILNAPRMDGKPG